jgi:hypothetical protein
MGNINVGGSNDLNPAGMMTSMLLGGAMGNQMANLLSNMGNTNNPQNNTTNNQTPPPPIPKQYFVAINGQQSGPYDGNQLQQLVTSGQLNQSTLVWKQGMQNWEEAGKLLELQQHFSITPPPIPPQ